MNTKHTPGPWRWSDQYEATGNRKTWSLVSDADGYGILSCDGEDNSPQGLNDEANARLIAKAPEMYERIKQLAEDLEDGHWSNTKAALRKLVAEVDGEQA